jgi:hypothetical protein
MPAKCRKRLANLYPLTCIRAIIPTVNSTYVGSSARESPQLNQTVYEETDGTNIRDETHVTHEAHESARTLVARRTGRTTRLSRRSERNALDLLDTQS